jgi:hypothetical protein
VCIATRELVEVVVDPDERVGGDCVVLFDQLIVGQLAEFADRVRHVEATSGSDQYKNPVENRVLVASEGNGSEAEAVERSGAGVEPTEPWVTRPHRF